MEKVLKTAGMLGVLLIGIGVFYHYVIFLPGVERQREERVENEKREAVKKETSQQLSYESCKAAASRNYSANWATACVAVARTQKDRRQSCLADSLIMTNPYMGRNYCLNTFADTDPSPECSLPGGKADPIEQNYSDAKQRCLMEARSGL